MADNIPRVHRYQATLGGFLVNAWLVETATAVIAVDATLAVPSTDELRAQLDAIGKPLKAVLLTHGHPDHYTGIGELIRGRGDIPVLAPATTRKPATSAAIRRSARRTRSAG